MVCIARGGCKYEWWIERVNKHNLNEKVRMADSSFDGNPHWGVCVCVISAGPLTVLFLTLLVEVLLHHWGLKTINFSASSTFLCLRLPLFFISQSFSIFTSISKT